MSRARYSERSQYTYWLTVCAVNGGMRCSRCRRRIYKGGIYLYRKLPRDRLCIGCGAGIRHDVSKALVLAYPGFAQHGLRLHDQRIVNSLASASPIGKRALADGLCLSHGNVELRLRHLHQLGIADSEQAVGWSLTRAGRHRIDYQHFPLDPAVRTHDMRLTRLIERLRANRERSKSS